MPSKPLHPCAHPGCPTLTRDRHCPAHAQPAWSERRNTPERMRGRTLQTARQRLFDRQPLCVLCEARGIVRVATIRDHRIPLAEGGRDDESNEQALCQDCHDAKTQQEARRGRQR